MHRAVVVLLVVALTISCGADQATLQPGTQEPTDTERPTTGQPTSEPTTPASEASPPASEPAIPVPTAAPPAPLPEPVLGSTEEIVQQMFERAQAEQVVVSMLDQLGIGLYQPDGTAIRRGTEASDTDLYLFEPEARGLVAMLRAADDEDRLISFRDFHAALADLGFQGSAEELADAYAGAYEADFESLIAQLVFSLGGVDVEAEIPPLEAWLLLVDGFVPPNGTNSAAIASTAAEFPLIAANGSGWGVARDEVQALMLLPLEADPLLIVHVLMVVNSASVRVSVTPARAHEGHGSTGAQVSVTATVHALASTFMSPFSMRPLVPLKPLAGGGLAVRWQLPPELDRHGNVHMPAAAITDVIGRTSFTFTPQQEGANGEGYLTREFATLVAWVSGAQLITQAYGMPSLGALVGREIPGIGQLEIEWHEPQAMRISLVNTYDVTIGLILGEGHATGRDTFEGILALQEDGSWRGVVNGSATGSMETEFLGERCNSSWSAAQLVEVVGAGAPNALYGDFYFRFYPLTAPTGSMGSGKCPPSVSSYEGVDYAPYNDYSISQAAEDQGLVIILPQRPGGTSDYPVHLEGVVDANWNVTIEFLEPTP